MTEDEIKNSPVVKEFEDVSAKVRGDISSLLAIDDLDALSRKEAELRNAIQVLSVSSTKLSRLVYQIVNERRKVILDQNAQRALNRVKEVLGDA